MEASNRLHFFTTRKKLMFTIIVSLYEKISYPCKRCLVKVICKKKYSCHYYKKFYEKKENLIRFLTKCKFTIVWIGCIIFLSFILVTFILGILKWIELLDIVNLLIKIMKMIAHLVTHHIIVIWYC